MWRYQKFSSRLLPNFPETLAGFIERLVAFTEGKADLFSSVARIVIEAGTGNSRNPNILDQVLSEDNIVCEVEGADVGHDVISATWAEAMEARLRERRDQVVAAGSIILGKFLVIAVRQLDSHRAGFLQRGRSTDGKEGVILWNRGSDCRSGS